MSRVPGIVTFKAMLSMDSANLKAEAAEEFGAYYTILEIYHYTKEFVRLAWLKDSSHLITAGFPDPCRMCVILCIACNIWFYMYMCV